MKLTRRTLGRVVAGAALAPAALMQTAAGQANPDNQQRDWLAEARASRADSARVVARVAVPMEVEPAAHFRA